MAAPVPSNCLDPTFAFSSMDTYLDCLDYAASLEHDWTSLAKNGTFWGMIDACVEQYCENPIPVLGGCPSTGIHDIFPPGTADFMPWYSFSLCLNTKSPLNPDIGGVGVRPCNLIYLVSVH